MSKATITDPRIKVQPSKQLLEFLHENMEHIKEMPENVLHALKEAGFKNNTKVEIITDNKIYTLPKIDTDLLKKLCDNKQMEDTPLPMPTLITDDNDSDQEKEDKKDQKKTAYLYLNDLIWLNGILKKLREDHGSDVFLYNLMEKCQLELPKNSVIERNPELEKRCQRLRDEQTNREYMKMTKNVDSVLKNYPEDTIAFQLKSLNSQMIAVFQFVVSVITGFVFGFIGIPLLSGNMEFGARLLLGIFCGIVVAVAEIYFLAKKLHEYDDTIANLHKQQKKTGSSKNNKNE